MIEQLSDRESYRRRRKSAWALNTNYWLTQNLRHVMDTGSHIIGRLNTLLAESGKDIPCLLDMGFGSGWVLEKLTQSSANFSYIGVDAVEEFVESASNKHRGIRNVEFVLADIDNDFWLGRTVDIVVNAFNFFELCDLNQAMKNVSRHLEPGGKLYMSTIDRTFLILALSDGWESFHENLKRYAELPGVKYDFQRIDLGGQFSASLEYPSVLYSTQDYIEAAKAHNLQFCGYEEQCFTAHSIPKIYCHLEFLKG